MIRTLLILAIATSSSLWLHLTAASPQVMEDSLPDALSVMTPVIAGKPVAEAQAILERHKAELMVLPDVEGVRLCLEGICVDTENPAVLPKKVEGLPVKAFLPLRPAFIAGRSYREALAIFQRHREELMRLPGVEGVGLGMDGLVVTTENPKILPTEVEGLPVKQRHSEREIGADFN